MLLDLAARPPVPILEQIRLTEDTAELWFECSEEATPGQFIFLHRKGTSYRRPFSLHRVREGRASILYRSSDPRLQWMGRDSIELSGPLGRGFSPPQGERILLIGNGLELAPLAFFAKRWAQKATTILALGSFRTSEQVAGIRPFLEAGIPFRLHLENEGNTLLNTVKEMVEKHQISRLLISGTEGLMRVLADYAHQRRLPCEASTLRLMACEGGACLNCNLFLHDGTFTKICQSGPVFDARRVLWS